MCIVFFQFDKDYAYLAANREESTKRPVTFPVHHHNGIMHGIIAGEDRGPKGDSPYIGTWVGVNENKLIVAVTNRDDGVLHGKDKIKSRGLLCAEMLGCDTAHEALSFAYQELERGGYGGCNFVVLQPSEDNEPLEGYGWVLHAPGPGSIETVELNPGFHILTNLDINDPEDRRVKYLYRHWDHKINKADDFVYWSKLFCADSDIVIEDDEWGTISSTIITVDHKLIFDHCETKPQCFFDYKHYAHLMLEKV